MCTLLSLMCLLLAIWALTECKYPHEVSFSDFSLSFLCIIISILVWQINLLHLIDKANVFSV